MYQRVYPVRDPEARALWRAEQGDRCQFCLGKGDWRGLHCCHIIRFRRSDEPCNLILGCASCHDRCPGHDGGEYPKMTMGMVLTAKVLASPEEYDRVRLEELYGSPLKVEPLPEWLKEKRKQRGTARDGRV